VALDDGKQYQPVKALATYEQKLKRLQRQLSRKKKGSFNRIKADQKAARLHYKIACLRSDSIHKATTDIVLNFNFIAMEDPHVKGMVTTHKTAKSMSDAAMGEERRQLEYKAQWYSSNIHHVNRWFPSTKLCIDCGTLHGYH
jgi:putative transposase